ncbi:hypothetical protein [Longimicrobium sp.]|uniref:hypothetical protein n=1 Tax=Longimicrobium sp. TaxID=2029185 RepID=UPI002E34FCE9|nr:hypothetical protein [Longimicrobium sp.]HEX6036715.1 hypothetical protein [Longimicrobium sp.]
MRKLIVNLVSMGLFFPGVLALLFELDWMENTVYGTRFVLMVLAAASLPAWWAGRMVRRLADPRRNLFLLRGPEERATAAREASSAGFLAFAGVLALALFAASRLNHERARREDVVPVTVVALDYREYREAGARSPESFKLVVDVEGRREDVVVSAREWARARPGSRRPMRRLHGALGFAVLYSDALAHGCPAPCDTAPSRTRSE